MGPRSRERGEVQAKDGLRSYAVLQWGRARGSAERRSVQVGASPWSTLQWGRARGSAESSAEANSYSLPGNASMGPRSRERGENGVQAPPAARAWLQWGRARGSAESAEDRRQWERARRFNGAALAGARRACRRRWPKRWWPRFNGAALAGARREANKQQLWRLVYTVLQWGRARGSAERCRAHLRLLPDPGLLQWGRARGSAESNGERQIADVPSLASMGPRSRERGERATIRPTHPANLRFNGAALAGARRGPVAGGIDCSRLSGFNGAALAGARRVFDLKWVLKRKDRFNGAALAGARRVKWLRFIGHPAPASMGPRSRERGEDSLL